MMTSCILVLCTSAAALRSSDAIVSGQKPSRRAFDRVSQPALIHVQLRGGGIKAVEDEEKSLKAVEPRFSRARLFFRNLLGIAIGIAWCERWARAAFSAYKLKRLDDLYEITIVRALLDSASEDTKKDIHASFGKRMSERAVRAGVTFSQGLASAAIWGLILETGIMWPRHFRVISHDKAVPNGWRLATSRDVKINERRLKRDKVISMNTIAQLEDDNYCVRGSGHDPAGPKAVKHDGQCKLGHKLLVKATE